MLFCVSFSSSIQIRKSVKVKANPVFIKITFSASISAEDLTFIIYCISEGLFAEVLAKSKGTVAFKKYLDA